MNKIALLLMLPILSAFAETNGIPRWEDLPVLKFKGGLSAFWDVGGKNKETNMLAAARHGFKKTGLLNTYTDYIGRKKESIHPNPLDPWDRPSYFEKIVRRNSGQVPADRDIFVHDIEFHFEEDLDKLLTNSVLTRKAGTSERAAFESAYYREWAQWFTLPCRYAKELYPNMPVGIYGPQPFRRDYWGVSGGNAAQIDGTHKTDALLYRHILPAVDFVVVSIYCFYDTPGSVYYMASNVQENFQRVADYGTEKPIYAYVWLRYHNSNKKLDCRETDDFLAEAMAVVPYFCGAKATVLWGWEPKGEGPYYRNLPVFMDGLRRIAAISEKLGASTPVTTKPVHQMWKNKEPLLLVMRYSATEQFVLLANPWQDDSAETKVDFAVGAKTIPLSAKGKRCAIYHVSAEKAELVD